MALTVSSVDLRFGRGIGVNVANSSDITVADFTLYGTGSSGINITDGARVMVANGSVAATGNGGIFAYAGDRVTLTSAGHSLVNVSISNYNRQQFTYTPGIAFGGVGQSAIGCTVFDAPHQGIFLQGNNHSIYACVVHDVCTRTSDSGALYAGREWTYRGNIIRDTVFANINTAYPGSSNNVQAIYLDDR